MTIKPENQIYADIIGFVNNTLTILSEWFPNYNFSEWQVLQLNQPVKLTEIKPTIWVSCTTKNRRGWQYRNYEGYQPEQEFKQTNKFKHEIQVQFSALRSRLISDTVNTLNSADVLEYLKSYMLNPLALKTLRDLGFTIYQPSEVQTPDFFNDSDNFEFMPFFTTTFIIEQSFVRPQNEIDSIEYKLTKGI